MNVPRETVAVWSLPLVVTAVLERVRLAWLCVVRTSVLPAVRDRQHAAGMPVLQASDPWLVVDAESREADEYPDFI